MQAVCFTHTHLEKHRNQGKREITPKEREEIAKKNLNNRLQEIANNNFKKS